MSDSNASPDGGGFGPGAGGFTETTTTSWWERIKGACIGILVGLLLIPASSPGSCARWARC